MSDKPLPNPIEPTAFTPLEQSEGPSRWRARPLQIAVALVLAVFALALWFLFTARPVLFTFTPAEADLDIDGGIHLKIGNRYLMRNGNYRLHIEADGHYPLEPEVEVTGEDAAEFHFELQRLPGKLTFHTQPEGTRVTIDGDMIGETPLLEQEVEAGTRQLQLYADRHQPMQQEIEVTGMGLPQEFRFELLPAWATVTISSQPPGASVLLDGIAVADTPAELEILEGDHQIDLQLERYAGWRSQLKVIAGEDQQLPPVQLSPAEGLLKLSSKPGGANVTVDGEYRGQTPLLISLEPSRPHRLAIFKAGYSNAQRTLELEPEEERELRLTLKPMLGEILVKVSPADATVIVDGKAFGKGSQKLSLPAREQKLLVRAQGYRDHSQRFTPRQGLSQIIQVRLKTESEARLAELEPRIQTTAGQKMRLLKPGDFTMGASRRQPGRRANEVLHPVSLTRLFYLSESEVSNAEYRQFKPAHNSGRVQGNTLNNDRQPVVMVTWNDAALYCNWLSRKEKLPPFYKEENEVVNGFNPDSRGYRLPSEAEWAWAARVEGESLRKFSWGDNFPPGNAVDNFADKTSSMITNRVVPGYDDGHTLSAPTGSFSPNQHGIFNLGGNVAEWVHDVYSIPSTSGVPTKNPLGAEQGDNKVIRGASWAQGTITELRLSFRDYGNMPRDDVGFRIARYAEIRE